MRARWLWVKNNWKRLPHPIRWVVAATVGGSLVILGLTGLILPVIPGIPLLIAGFALLASEFTCAEVILNLTTENVTKAVNKVRKKN
jgi:uncharacterized protein YqgC (DUF456 family)